MDRVTYINRPIAICIAADKIARIANAISIAILLAGGPPFMVGFLSGGRLSLDPNFPTEPMVIATLPLYIWVPSPVAIIMSAGNGHSGAKQPRKIIAMTADRTTKDREMSKRTQFPITPTPP